MNGRVKKTSVALLAGACVLCAGAGFALRAPEAAFAAENYVAYINIGANDAAVENDAALGNTAKGFTAAEPGTVVSGDSLFTSYAKNATYTASSLASANYEVAVAVIAESGLSVKVNGADVAVPAEASGRTVLYAKAESATEVEIEVTGKFCGAMVAAEGSDALFGLDFAPGQVIPYGALLADVLEKPTGYYMNGTSRALEVAYGNIAANTGVDLNFTTVEDVPATITLEEGTTVTVNCNITTMPDDLVYFINCGSFTVDGDDPNTADQKYSYNQKIFEYYGESLINQTAAGEYIPDQVSSSSSTWGRYGIGTWSNPGDSTFPYNTYVWTNVDDYMGYYLTGLDPDTSYRIWLGTLSHWHPRTCDITFTGKETVRSELYIGGEKGFTVYENIQPAANGLVDMHMVERGDQNEPTICFIAVQKMETEIPAVPSDPAGDDVIGVGVTEYTFTGATAGAKVQVYNAAKPNQVLYEEIVDGGKISGGSYTIDWGTEFENVAQFRIVQVTKGGASATVLVTITDITDMEVKVVTEGYVTDKVSVSVKAKAESGIAKWEYRFGEYGDPVVKTYDAGRPKELDDTFEADRNGTYYIVVTSGRNVTLSGEVEVSTVDNAAPVLSVLPSKDGWKEGSYNVTLQVESVAPVKEYKLLKDGVVVEEKTEAPASIKFATTGRYTLFVRTEAGQSAQTSVHVSGAPTLTQIKKTNMRNGARYTFGDTADSEVAELSVYKLASGGVQRQTIVSGTSIDLASRNGAGTYVATVKTATGEVEMFAFTVERSDLGNSDSKGGDPAVQLGVGLGVGIGGLALSAAGIVTTVLLKKKKR